LKDRVEARMAMVDIAASGADNLLDSDQLEALVTEELTYREKQLIRLRDEVIALEELIANALIHRDYFVSAPVRILVFSDRVEIISPGHLPNNLTIENIKMGDSIIRNPILASYATKILPYRGIGSGIIRALKEYADIDFEDDHDGNRFIVTVLREKYETN
ncbi:MAG: hypothetical protein IMY80_01660, partial [Chloroflexi bacterium]|nr:hypothetical protein [Chloroflexota bacterium]